MDKPRAAAAIWPYPHRNLAEIDAEALERAQRLVTRKAVDDAAFDTQVRRLQAAARAEGLCASMGDGEVKLLTSENLQSALSRSAGKGVDGLPTFSEQSA